MRSKPAMMAHPKNAVVAVASPATVVSQALPAPNKAALAPCLQTVGP
jgi:hypothetical protein